jgi:hypothetical protein
VDGGGAAVNWVKGSSQGPLPGIAANYVRIDCGVVAWGDDAHIMRVGFHATVTGDLFGLPQR